jgi:hypothetical protein
LKKKWSYEIAQKMSKALKIIEKVLSGRSDQKIEFLDLCTGLKRLGCNERIKGSQHIYWKNGVREIINLQPKGSKAKSYQVKQVRNLVLDYKLTVIELYEQIRNNHLLERRRCSLRR